MISKPSRNNGAIKQRKGRSVRPRKLQSERTSSDNAKEQTRSGPPKAAKTIRSNTSFDRIAEVLTDKTRCRTELQRLYRIIAGLTCGEAAQTKARYFDEKGLAIRWKVSVKHVRNMRYAGKGPKITYFGRSVRYRLRDVQAFEKSSTFTSSAAKEQAGRG